MDVRARSDVSATERSTTPYGAIPSNILSSGLLSAYDKLYFTFVALRSGWPNLKGSCWYSDQSTSDFLKISIMSVRRARGKLLRLGIIEGIQRNGETWELWINDTTSFSQNEGVVLTERGTSFSQNDNTLKGKHMKENTGAGDDSPARRGDIRGLASKAANLARAKKDSRRRFDKEKERRKARDSKDISRWGGKMFYEYFQGLCDTYDVTLHDPIPPGTKNAPAASARLMKQVIEIFDDKGIRKGQEFYDFLEWVVKNWGRIKHLLSKHPFGILTLRYNADNLIGMYKKPKAPSQGIDLDSLPTFTLED